MDFPYPVVTIDFETYYAPGFGFRSMATTEYIRDPRWQVIGVGLRIETVDGVEFTAMEEWEFCEWLDNGGREFLNSGAILCHNTFFDGAILSWLYGVFPKMWYDSLSMAHPIHGTEVGGSLGILAPYYGIGEKGDDAIKSIGKRREDFTQEEWEQYMRYCMNDCFLTWGVFEKMVENGFPESELRVIDTTIRMFTEPSFVLDEVRMQAFHDNEVQRKSELLAKLGKDKSILMSNEKFAALLMSMGVVPPMKWSKKKQKEDYAFAKTDVEFKALEDHRDPMVRAAVAARLGVKSTINVTRASRFLRMGKDGQRVPVFLKYCGAHTTRWSGADKTNFQNLERVDDELGEGTIRLSLMAPDGHRIVVGDSAQIEARVGAWLTGQEDIVEAFREDRDIYSEFASKAYGRKIEGKKRDASHPLGAHTPTAEEKEARQVGKIAELALQFGQGGISFAKTMLAGPMGGKPVRFTAEDMATMRVDYKRFLSNPERVAKAQAIPCPQGLDILVHTAVCQHLVDTYRATHVAVTKFWYEVAPAVLDAMYEMEPGDSEEMGPLKIVKDALVLPSGLALRYPGLRREEDVSGRGESVWSYSYRNMRFAPKKPKKGGDPNAPIIIPHQRLYGGLLLENIVQALARVIVSDQMLAIAPLYKVVTTTHDEIVLCVREEEADEALAMLLAVMQTPPEWCLDCPIMAEGGHDVSYGLAK